MTSLVQLAFDESSSRMSFVMPPNMNINELPKPNDLGVKFSESEEKYVVVVRLGGWAGDKKIAKNVQNIVDLLKAKGVDIKTEPLYMGYNPPFQVLNRL